MESIFRKSKEICIETKTLGMILETEHKIKHTHTHTHTESLWYIPKNVKQANKQDISKYKLTSSITAVITLSVYCEQCSLGE